MTSLTTEQEDFSHVRVVILAAGTGSRLMPLTRNTPKSLLDLGNGYTLLERQLEAIQACGVTKVTLVTGYKSDQIEAKITHYSEFDISFRFNPFYKLANNIVSAWLGLQGVTAPVVLVNGDDVFHASVLERVMRAGHPVTMMVCKKDSYDDDDMKVRIGGDLVRDVGKGIPVGEADGDAIGMTYFDSAGLEQFQMRLLDRLRDDANLNLFYVHCLKDLMDSGYPVRFAECKEEEWAEVDFHPDLEIMRDQVLKGLQGGSPF